MKQATWLYKLDKGVIVDKADTEKYDAMIAEGYKDHPHKAEPFAEAGMVKEDATPTRAELEQKAEELKLKFDGRTSDAKLAKMIEEAL